ncbi:MAG: methyltransferase domain-containing protein [Polyangiaceae bacterium]
MLTRVLEPEVMDSAQEADDYDAMDHAAVNRACVDDLLALGPDLHATIDLGTGTALIAIALCQRDASARVVAIDLADSMLALGARNVAAAGADVAARISLERRDAKATGLASASVSTVFSNSLVHHLPEPGAFFSEIARVLAPGGLAFVRDLRRPEDETSLATLVERYAAIPSELIGDARARAERQRGLFADSLRAALTVDEVDALARAAGITGARAASTSDRHFTWIWRRS